jgi:DNA-binding NarL/FixJ family response regulator
MNWPSLQCVVIAETLPLYRDGLVELAGLQSPGARIVRTNSVVEIMALAAKGEAPDLFLIDLALPGLDVGLVLPELRRQHRKAAIVTLAADDDEVAIIQALQSGSDGFVHKAMPRESFIAAIGRVLAGQFVIEREVGSALGVSNAGIVLTARQHDVLALLAQGASNKEIARGLGISHFTVRLYVSALLRIFGVNRRKEVAAKARLLGTLAPN